MFWDEYYIQKPVPEGALPAYMEASPDPSLSNSCRNRAVCRSIYTDSRPIGLTAFYTHLEWLMIIQAPPFFITVVTSILAALEAISQHCLVSSLEKLVSSVVYMRGVLWWKKNKLPNLPCHISQGKSGKNFLNSNATSYYYFFPSFCEVIRGISTLS